MALMSLAEFGKSHGVSRQAAAKWKSRGVLVIREDKVDVEASDRRMQHAGLGRYAEKARSSTTESNQQPAAAIIIGGEFDESAALSFIERLMSGQFAPIVEANQVKENALAAKHLLEARKAAGELVEMKVAEGVLAEAAQHARDSWLNFPSRIGPLLATDLGVEPGKIVEALTGYVHKELDQLADDGLTGIGAKQGGPS
jgi:hypothetical protein